MCLIYMKYNITITNSKERSLTDTGMGLVPQKEWLAVTNFEKDEGLHHYTGTGDTPNEALDKLIGLFDEKTT